MTSRRASDLFGPLFESLEARQLLAAYVVDTLSDVTDGGDGLTTLREAIVAANAEVFERFSALLAEA